MPRALLTGLDWDYHGYYSDDPHWEEKLFGDRHSFPRWYHNNIRYRLLEWGPLGWCLLLWRRMRREGKRQGYRIAVTRCPDCHSIMWPSVVGFGVDGGPMYCGDCSPWGSGNK